MINVMDIIADPDLGASSFVVTRTLPSTLDDDGTVTRGPMVPLPPVMGNVQPSKSGDVLQFLPEGERNKASITIYSPQLLQLGDGQGKESDLIAWNGQTYRVQYCKDWSSRGYWWAMATNCVVPA